MDKKKLTIKMPEIYIPDVSKLIDFTAINNLNHILEEHRTIMEQQSLAIRKLSIPIFEQIKLIDTSFIHQLATTHFKRLELISNSLRHSILPILDTFKNIDFESFNEYYNEFGWLESISFSYANELRKELKDAGHDEVWNKLMSDIKEEAFIQELKTEISSNSILKKREKILFKILEHHINKDYISSIPILLSQIEGSLWDIAIKMKKIEDKPNSTILLNESGDILLWTDGKYEGKPRNVKFSELLHIIFSKDSKFKEHTSENVYGEFRNPIHHGRDVDYYDEKRSAMLILMLNVVLNKCQEVCKDE